VHTAPVCAAGRPEVTARRTRNPRSGGGRAHPDRGTEILQLQIKFDFGSQDFDVTSDKSAEKDALVKLSRSAADRL